LIPSAIRTISGDVTAITAADTTMSSIRFIRRSTPSYGVSVRLMTGKPAISVIE